MTSASFSPDGARVVTSSRDGTARLWEVPLAGGSLGEWTAIAEKSSYRLVNGVLAPRARR